MTLDFTEVEARVVGALIEKAATTPDVYPMTTNAIVTACNQKTNRDPVVAYTAVMVDAALLELRQRNIVRRVHSPGSRSTKHRQTLDEVLSLDAGELALVSVLLLRGPQTLGELRMRSERQHSFDDLESTEAALERLAARTEPLVRQLARQPGHKEARWQHLLLDPDLAGEVADATQGAVETQAPSAGQAPAAVHAENRENKAPVSSTATNGQLVDRVAELESQVATLRRQLTSLASQLGEDLD